WKRQRPTKAPHSLSWHLCTYRDLLSSIALSKEKAELSSNRKIWKGSTRSPERSFLTNHACNSATRRCRGLEIALRQAGLLSLPAIPRYTPFGLQVWKKHLRRGDMDLLAAAANWAEGIEANRVAGSPPRIPSDAASSLFPSRGEMVVASPVPTTGDRAMWPVTHIPAQLVSGNTGGDKVATPAPIADGEWARRTSTVAASGSTAPSRRCQLPYDPTAPGAPSPHAAAPPFGSALPFRESSPSASSSSYSADMPMQEPRPPFGGLQRYLQKVVAGHTATLDPPGAQPSVLAAAVAVAAPVALPVPSSGAQPAQMPWPRPYQQPPSPPTQAPSSSPSPLPLGGLAAAATPSQPLQSPQRGKRRVMSPSSAVAPRPPPPPPPQPRST
ncbi:unnamed protein product, partial [Phaeothamnion confervicola]